MSVGVSGRGYVSTADFRHGGKYIQDCGKIETKEMTNDR